MPAAGFFEGSNDCFSALRATGFAAPGAAVRLVAALLCSVLLAGCGSGPWDAARTETGDTAERIAALKAEPEGPRYSAIRVIERRPWLGLVRQEAAETGLPAHLLQADAVTLPLAGIGEAGVLARRIEAATGLGVRFTGQASAGEGASAADGFAGIDRLSPDGGVWTGPLDALLDAWTGAAGYAWRHDGDGIEIVRREARVFRIHALAGKQRYAASASTDDAASGGSEGGDGGGVTTSQSIAAETDYDPWPEIEAQAAVLAGPGAAVAAAPSSASLLVTGTPRDVGRVRSYLSWLNREVLRPVTLSVHVYSVRRESEADYGIGIAAAVSELFGTSAQLAVSPESIAVIRPAQAVGDTLSATVRALSRAGTVSRVLSADIPGAGIPGPLTLSTADSALPHGPDGLWSHAGDCAESGDVSVGALAGDGVQSPSASRRSSFRHVGVMPLFLPFGVGRPNIVAFVCSQLSLTAISFPVSK